MPTDKPKVSAYVPQPVKDSLVAFEKERNISESQAVTVILAEYFGLKSQINHVPDGSIVGGVTLSEFKELREKVEFLLSAVSSLQSNLLGTPNTQAHSKNEKPVIKVKVEEVLDIPNNTEDSQTPETKESDSKPFYNLLSEPLYKLVSGRVLSAQRFKLGKDTVAGKKKSLLDKDSLDSFIKWTRGVDPDKIAWEPSGNPVKGYVPVGELTSEQQSSLLKWMEEHNIK